MIKEIYNKYKGKLIPCLVNNECGNLVDGYGVVCGYKEQWLVLGFNTETEGCIKSFTKSVFIDNPNMLSYRYWNVKHLKVNVN